MINCNMVQAHFCLAAAGVFLLLDNGVGTDIPKISSINELESNNPPIFSELTSQRQLVRQKRSEIPTLYFADQNISVTVNKNRDFSGENLTLSVPENGCFSWRIGDNWNDNVSAIVTHGKCLRVWSYEDCTGHSVCFCWREAELRHIPLTATQSWNNEITAFSGCGFRGYSTIANLYEDRDYKGDYYKAILQKDECVSFLWSPWNDSISSVKVKTGCLEYFIDAFCKGSSFKLREDEPYVGTFYNDRISSFRPC